MTSKELLEQYAAGVRDFRGANLRRANLRGADLRDAILTGANLTHADLRGAFLCDADLTYANLRAANLTGAFLVDAKFTDANLTDANLTYANLTNADLADANLTYANLTGANLTGAKLPKAPVVADLDRRMCEVTSVPGALDMSSWHTCETTHCRAGWAVILAGAEGKELEDRVGSAVAGALIYHASTGVVPNFYSDDDTAMSDINARAGVK